MDLLTVLMHEVGHLLGHEHTDGGVMSETLTAGERMTLSGISFGDRIAFLPPVAGDDAKPSGSAGHLAISSSRGSSPGRS